MNDLLYAIYTEGIGEVARKLEVTEKEILAMVDGHTKDCQPIKNRLVVKESDPITKELVNKQYNRLYKSCVYNKHKIILGKTDEDVFHEALIRVMAIPEVKEADLLSLIKQQMKADKYRNSLESVIHKAQEYNYGLHKQGTIQQDYDN